MVGIKVGDIVIQNHDPGLAISDGSKQVLSIVLDSNNLPEIIEF